MNYAPLNFDLCFLDIWATLRAGGCVVLVDERYATNGAFLARLLARWNVEIVQGVPMLFGLMIEASRGLVTLPDARHVIVTGDSITRNYLEQFPSIFPRARFYNVYGCTETNDSFMHEVRSDSLLTDQLPIGTPLPGVSFQVVDDMARPVAENEVGELLVATPFQTLGYVGQSHDTGKFLARNTDGGARTLLCNR